MKAAKLPGDAAGSCFLVEKNIARESQKKCLAELVDKMVENLDDKTRHESQMVFINHTDKGGDTV